MNRLIIKTSDYFKIITLLLVSFLLLFCSCATNKGQNVDFWIERLDHQNYNERYKAAKKLRKLSDKKAVLPLINALIEYNDNWKFRQVIIETLVNIGDEAVEPLITVLNNDDEDVRYSAVIALGKIENTQAIEPLVTLLLDENVYVRKYTVEALENLSWEPKSDYDKVVNLFAKDNKQDWIILSTNLLKQLVDALKYDSCRIRVSAVWVLGEIGNPNTIGPLIEALKCKDEKEREVVANALVKFGHEAVLPLIIALKSDDYNTPIWATWILGEIGDPRAVVPLIESIIDNKTKYHYEEKVEDALVKIDYLSIYPLISSLRSNDNDVRITISNVLGRVRDSNAIDPLICTLQDMERNVRESAARALDNLNWQPQSNYQKTIYLIAKGNWQECVEIGEDAVEPLIYALKYDKDNYRIRLYAVWALEDIGDQRAIEPLTAVLKDNDPKVRESAAKALDKLKWKPQSNKQKTIYLIAKGKWQECVKIGTDAVEPLISSFKYIHNSNLTITLSGMGSFAIEPLIAALEDSNDYIRAGAAESLGKIGDPKAVDPLIKLLQDEIRFVRNYAAEALDKLNWEPQTDYQKSIYFIATERWTDCKNIGIGSVETLIKTLNNNNSYIRERVAEILGEIGDLRAVEPLIIAMEKMDYLYNTSPEYAEALGKIGDPKATEPLIKVLKENDTSLNNIDIKVAAAIALGNIGDLKAMEPLIEVLKDKYPDLRAAAAEALGKIGNPKVIDKLIALLYDDNFNVISKTIESLQYLRWTPQDNYQKILCHIVMQEWQECANFGADAVDPLIKAIRNCSQYDYYKRKKMIYSLSQIGQLSVSPLICALTDSNEYLRQSAAEALGLIGDSLAVEPLIATLDDKIGDVRGSAVESLGLIGDTRANDPLLKILKDDDEWFVRSKAGIALGKMGNRNIIPRLEYLLKSWYSGIYALNALRMLKWDQQTLSDTIHVLVAERDKVKLLQMWDKAKMILLNDIISNNYLTVENALYGFIGIGKQEIIPELIGILNKSGTKTTAEAYLNCGNNELVIAAKSWASKNGYYIQNIGGSSPVRWGGM